MKPFRSLCRTAAILLTTVAIVLTTTPAQAKRVHPGALTGYGFDTCVAPTQAEMDRWLTTSPFWAVGIYIAGSMRGCKAQPNLDAAWVARQSRNGWRLLPLTVGRQASCSTQDRYTDRISANPARKYAAARAQGRAEAASSV